jgi:uncharacterized damage-inducible protein DinB
MDISCTDFLSNLESLHDKIKELITSQPQQTLDWSPQPGVESLNMIVSHVTGAERYWIGEVVGREQPARRLGSVYQVTGLDKQELGKRLDDALSCCRKALEKCESGDLNERRISPRDGREVTVRWSLEHVMEHTANHQREINFILQFGKSGDRHIPMENSNGKLWWPDLPVEANSYHAGVLPAGGYYTSQQEHQMKSGRTTAG